MTPRKTIIARLLLPLAALIAIVTTVLGTWALWHDDVPVEGSIQTGVVLFDVGRPGEVLDTATGTGDGVSFPITRDDAQTLVANGEVAIPIRVRSVSQGNRGLYYELDFPTGFQTDTPFAQATNKRLFKVSDPADCTVANAPATQPSPTDSTPQAADYTSSSTPDSEFWCFTAEWEPLEVTNVAGFTGGEPGRTVNGTDSQTVTLDVDTSEGSNPDVPIDFTWHTFRPGDEP